MPLSPEKESGRFDHPHNATILLVEDDEPVRRLARVILESEGFSVLEARDAKDAVSHSQSYPGSIELLVTDVMMPGTSGMTLAKQIVGERPGIKVLFLSGYTADIIPKDDDYRGMQFLKKPFTPGMLLQEVRQMLLDDMEPATVN